MKASIIAASAALVGSVAAAQHYGHAGFHMRRGAYAEPEEICTVYTTVYVTQLPSMAPNSTVYEPSHVPQTSSSSCTEEGKTSVYTPPAVHSTKVSESSVYTPPVVYSTKVPETSSSCTDEGKTSVYTPPAVHSTKVPETSKQVYPSAPASEPSKAVSTPVPVVESSKFTPKPSTPVYPVVESSKPVPESSAPAYTPEPHTSKYAETTKPVISSSKPVTSSSKPVPSSSRPTPSSSKSSEQSKPTGSYNEGGRIKINGNKWAMTYTPYAADGNCKSADEVKSDIKIIADLGFTTIRSYSTDCGVFENVVPECEKYGLKVIYGIFLEAGGKDGKGCFSEYANKQLNDIIDNAPKDGIAMIIVGNECMFSGNCQPADLASYIDYVRTEFHNAGFPKDIAITTTEPVGTWEEKGAALCDHIDVFACQVHPYFTTTITAEMAGDFAAQQLEQAAKVCPEAAKKGKYISEIGWPSAGQSNGMAVAGVEEQRVAMHKIIEKVGSESTIFSFKDDPWKQPGSLGVEQHFGCIDVLY